MTQATGLLTAGRWYVIIWPFLFGVVESMNEMLLTMFVMLLLLVSVTAKSE